MRTRVLGWRWRHNPLRRRSDVVEAWAALIVAVVLGLGAPLAAAAAGVWAYDTAQAKAAAQRAERHHIRAVLVADAPAAVPIPQGVRQPTYEVKVRWSEPGGRTRTGEARVPAGTLRGTRTDVWLDERGRPVAPPMSAALVWQRTLMTGTFTAGGVVGVVLAAQLAVRRTAIRHRMTEWEREWARTGPDWGRRTA